MANDFDPDTSDILSIIDANIVGENGSISIINNQLVFDPNNDFAFLSNGETIDVLVNYTISDNHGAQSNSTATITITGSDGAPVITGDIIGSLIEDATPLTLTTTGQLNIVDPDNGESLFIAETIAGSYGSLTIDEDGNWSYSADNNQTAIQSLAQGDTLTDTIEVESIDGTTQSITITITGTNDAPIVDSISARAADEGDSSISGTITASDVDDNALLSFSSDNVAGFILDENTGEYSFDPSDAAYDHLELGATETITIPITVTDEHGATDTQNLVITLTGTNDAPTAVADTITITEDSSAISINSGDLLNGTYSGGQADYDIDDNSSISISDINTSGMTGDISILYNMGEVGQVNVSSSGTTISFSGEFTNPVVFAFVTTKNESDAVIARVSNVGQKSFDLKLVEPYDRTDPNDTTHGIETVSYVVLEAGIWELPDGTKFEVGTFNSNNVASGTSDTSTISFTNDFSSAPNVFSQIQTSNNGFDFIKTRQNGSTNDNVKIGIEKYESDSSDLSSNETIAYFAMESGSGSWNGHNFVVGQTPDQVRHSNYNQSFGTDLGAGNINIIGQLDSFDGGDDSALRGVGTSSTGATFFVEEDKSKDTEINHTTETANFFAIAGQGLLTAKLISTPTTIPASQISSIEYDPGNLFDYLAVGETAYDTFTYTITDEHGATTTETVTIEITGTNDTPIAVVDSASTSENNTLTIDVLANDTDIDTSDVLTISSASIVGSNKGSVLIVNDELVFNPGADFDCLAVGESEVITINYTIDDGNGGTDSSTVTVTVTGTNDAPIAVADTASTSENAILTIDALSNDIDLDASDILSIISASVAGTNNGSVSIINNQLVFNPSTDFDYLAVGESEVITINYTIEDSQGVQSSSTATITVTGTNDDPVAVADSLTISENANATTIDVIANDYDVDLSDTLSITSASIVGSNKGTVSIINNELVFNPGTDFDQLSADEQQQITINYTIDDGHGGTANSSVIITVTGTNDAPVAVADTFSSSGYVAVVDATANDIDVDNTYLTITSASVASGTAGTVQIIYNKIVYIPNFDSQLNDYYGLLEYTQPGSASAVVNYTVEDQYGAQSSSTVDISLNNLNYYIVYDSSYYINVSSNNAEYYRFETNSNRNADMQGGDDVAIGGGGRDTLRGGSGDDYIEGNANRDNLYGDAGDDILIGGADRDNLYGGTGNDILIGGDDPDNLYGGDGNDILSGGDGDDDIEGGAGDDFIEGGTGEDDIDGGSGIDTVSYENSSSAVNINLDTNNHSGGDADDDNISNVENVIGSNFDDTIIGDDEDNIIIGGKGNDNAYGLEGHDTYVYTSGDGNDYFHGGSGGSWTDTIELSNIHTGPAEGNWSLVVTNSAEYTIDSQNQEITFDSAASGTITLSSGEELSFDEVEKIIWNS